jgi:hypothetical protein
MLSNKLGYSQNGRVIVSHDQLRLQAASPGDVADGCAFVYPCAFDNMEHSGAADERTGVRRTRGDAKSRLCLVIEKLEDQKPGSESAEPLAMLPDVGTICSNPLHCPR